MKNTEKTKSKKDVKEKEQAWESGCGCGDIVNDFIEDAWSVMTPQMVDQLKCILRNDLGLSKRDVDKFIECQREIRRQRICVKKNQRTVKIGPRNQWIKEVSKDVADQMAALVVGVLLSNRTARTKRVTEKVLERLCEITGEDTTVESAKSRVERTLVVVADRMATWIDEAISDIEKSMQDLYMSAESLEELSVPIEECYTGTSSSDVSIRESYLSYKDSKTKLSVGTNGSEEEQTEKKKREERYKTGEEVKSDETDEDSSEATKEEESSAEESSKEETEEDEEIEEEGEEVEEDEEVEEEDEEEDEVEEEEEEESEEMSSEAESEPEEGEDVEDEEEEVEEEEDEEEEGEEEEGEEEVDEEMEEEELVEEEGKIEEQIMDIEDVKIVKEPSEESKVLLPDSSSTSTEINKFQGDILDLLKEDIANLSREEEESERQKAMKEVIDKRLENIAREKLQQSLDSLIQFDIDEAAAVVANWVEKILATADQLPPSLANYKSQGPAFEIKRGSGSQYEVSKVSSTSVAQKVAEVRGLDPPLRKKKIPRTMSPMNLTSGKDWADWVLGAANVGEEWGKWLDETITDVENHLLTDRSLRSHRENYSEWKDWRDKRAQEAQKWRVEKHKIKDEGKLWNKKLKSDLKQTPEAVTLTHIY